MINPVLLGDFPDPDVIRVNDTYYMLTSTRHFTPGGVIMRSFDLVHWEIASYLYDEIEGSPREKMMGEQSMYGYGMIFGSIAHHHDKFYAMVQFREDNEHIYIFEANTAEGPWKKTRINGNFYKASLFFDDDDRVYMIYGYETIYVMELTDDVSGIKENGLSRSLYTEHIEGYSQMCEPHAYKRNGKYYIFTTNWPKGNPGIRVHYCLMGDTLEAGKLSCHEVFRTEGDAKNQGIAEGNIVDTPDGKWYAMLCQDRGAIGRLPVLVPITWDGDFPVFGEQGKLPDHFDVHSTRPYYTYEPWHCSDPFVYTEGKNHQLKMQWQWNHVDSKENWWIAKEGGLCIRTAKISSNLIQAQNTLTQRCVFPQSTVEVCVDGSLLKNGDYAGICCLQGCYGFVGITKEINQYYVVAMIRDIYDCSLQEVMPDYLPGTIVEKIPMNESSVTFQISTNFENMKDLAQFAYEQNGRFVTIGKKHHLYFKLDHFAGCRYGLTVYATKETGGVGRFTNFRYFS